MEQADLLRFALDVLDAQGLGYMLVGSLAGGIYGEGRSTLDIDMVVDLSNEQVDALLAAFPAPDYYVSPTAARDAVARGGQFNVIHPSSGNKIDFLLVRRDDYGAEQFSRRRNQPIFPERSGFVAAPEDVILGKMIYFREGEHEKHLRDIASMLLISGAEIDREYVARWALQLGLTEIWQAILLRVDSKP